jgi:hypothetical protein
MFKADYMLFAADRKVDQMGKMDLIGVCEKVFSFNVPLKIDGLKVVLRLFPTDGSLLNEPVKFKLSFKLGTKEVSKIELEDRLTIDEGDGWSPAFDISSVMFPAYADYQVSFYANGKRVITRVFTVARESDLTKPVDF